MNTQAQNINDQLAIAMIALKKITNEYLDPRVPANIARDAIDQIVKLITEQQAHSKEKG